MSGNTMTFDDKKLNKSSFYKNKLFNINDIDVTKILISKRNVMVKKAHLNTFLDIMMMPLDLYV